MLLPRRARAPRLVVAVHTSLDETAVREHREQGDPTIDGTTQA